MIHNPYKNIDWSNTIQTKSFSHSHVIKKESFEWFIEQGYKHFPISHYSPAKPWYPLENYYDDVPDDVLGSPNSEQSNSSNGMGHVNALGSFYESEGTLAPDDAVFDTWQTTFDNIFNELQFENGGGITINHSLRENYTKEFLDYDDRVLGMEIYNNTVERGKAGGYEDIHLDYLNVWDKILSTGRRCYGFSVIDWPNEDLKPLYGSNIVLSDEFTEKALLESYRKGSFYTIVKDVGLRFDNIVATDDSISVSVNKNAILRFHTEKGVAKEVKGTSATYQIKENPTFIRISVSYGEDKYAKMYSNPIMYKNKKILEEEERYKKYKAKLKRNIILLN